MWIVIILIAWLVFFNVNMYFQKKRGNKLEKEIDELLKYTSNYTKLKKNFDDNNQLEIFSKEFDVNVNKKSEVFFLNKGIYKIEYSSELFDDFIKKVWNLELGIIETDDDHEIVLYNNRKEYFMINSEKAECFFLNTSGNKINFVCSIWHYNEEKK